MLSFILVAIVGLLVGFGLGIYLSGKRKTDGALDISDTDSSKIYQLEINTEPEDLAKKKQIVLRINQIKAAT